MMSVKLAPPPLSTESDTAHKEVYGSNKVNMHIKASERLILALDVPLGRPHGLIELSDARALVEQLDGVVSFFKIGWPLYMAGGQALIPELVNKGKRVFLDLKFGDIPETIKRLVLVARDHGVSFITVNTSFDAVRAAVAVRGESDLKILTVTVLTSLADADLREMGVDTDVETLALYKAKKASEFCDGVIASGKEAALIRQNVRKDFLIVTPGIRPVGRAHDDHKRATTPTEAISAGADYLVVGRPITQVENPRNAAAKIITEMQDAFDALAKP